MADYAKDSEKQAALRRQIEKHPDLAVPAGGASAAQPRVAELVSARV